MVSKSRCIDTNTSSDRIRWFFCQIMVCHHGKRTLWIQTQTRGQIGRFLQRLGTNCYGMSGWVDAYLSNKQTRTNSDRYFHFLYLTAISCHSCPFRLLISFPLLWYSAEPTLLYSLINDTLTSDTLIYNKRLLFSPEFRVAAAGSNETLTKVNWLPQQDNLLVVGQRAGKVDTLPSQ